MDDYYNRMCCITHLFSLQVGKTHEEMEKIARLLPYVSHKGEIVEITEPIDPSKFLPG